jgi:hypothetical protein
MRIWTLRLLLLLVIVGAHSGLVMGQGCGVVMTKNYSVYVSSTSDGSHIYSTVTLEGSASCSPSPACPCNTAVHTPKVKNITGTVGGTQTGPGTCVSCYISQQNNQTVAAAAGSIDTISWEGDITCSIAGFFYGSGGSTPAASYTPVQHTYSGKPLAAACWISQFYDHVANGKSHRAEDVVNSNSTNSGGVKPAYGTQVNAAEAGTVVAVSTGNPAASQGYPACVGKGALANYVKIKGSDGYFTVYVHITPSVVVGASVTQGQKIGITDNSGCQSGGHVHMARKDPNNIPVNFTIPCQNKLPTNSFADGLVNDDVPDTL